MQTEMLDAINHGSVYKIMKDAVDIYEAEKHRLPCWNCVVGPMCFNEKKATKRAKYLGYTVEFRDRCTDSILAMDLIYMAMSKLLELSLAEIDNMTISELMQEATELYAAINGDLADGKEFGPTMYASFISITQRDANNSKIDVSWAYNHLGEIFKFNFGEIDHALELYNKAIELNPEAADNFAERGDCFYVKEDYKSALNDFKKAKELDKENMGYLNHIIEKCERKLR
jgi:tetratricopeptide (TPR) repeat protein